MCLVLLGGLYVNEDIIMPGSHWLVFCLVGYAHWADWVQKGTPSHCLSWQWTQSTTYSATELNFASSRSIQSVTSPISKDNQVPFWSKFSERLRVHRSGNREYWVIAESCRVSTGECPECFTMWVWWVLQKAGGIVSALNCMFKMSTFCAVWNVIQESCSREEGREHKLTGLLPNQTESCGPAQDKWSHGLVSITSEAVLLVATRIQTPLKSGECGWLQLCQPQWAAREINSLWNS